MRNGFQLTYFVKYINKHCFDTSIDTLYVSYSGDDSQMWNFNYCRNHHSLHRQSEKKGFSQEQQQGQLCFRHKGKIMKYYICAFHLILNIDRCVMCRIHSILTPILIIVGTKISVSPRG